MSQSEKINKVLMTPAHLLMFRALVVNALEHGKLPTHTDEFLHDCLLMLETYLDMSDIPDKLAEMFNYKKQETWQEEDLEAGEASKDVDVDDVNAPDVISK